MVLCLSDLPLDVEVANEAVNRARLPAVVADLVAGDALAAFPHPSW